jgi:hypothetical protein
VPLRSGSSSVYMPTLNLLILGLKEARIWLIHRSQSCVRR